QKIRQAFPGDLVRVIGGNFPTELGEKFLVIKDERTKKEILQEVTNWSEKKNQPALSPSSGKKNVNLVLLADSQNSQEALNNLVAKSDNSQVNFSVVYSSVGKLNSFGLNLAKITQSVILAFGYQFSSSEIKIFRENNLSFYSSKIIYEIEEKLKKIVENQQEKKQVEKVMGVAQVSHVFYFSKVGNIAGCQIISGKIARNNFVHVFRGEEQLFTGSIRSLESDKITVKEISSGRECGIVLKGFDDFQIGDKVIAFQMKEESILTNE
ncbi:10523_t:CDS:1, partial [Racocetra persica]